MRIRKIQLLIGPLVDTENTDTTQALELVTTGASNELAVQFSVVKSIDSTLNRAEFLIENLNRETESKLNQENLAVELRAGWLDAAPTQQDSNPSSETGILTIHKGGIKAVDPTGNLTRFSSVDGAGPTFFAVTNLSYSGSDSLEQVVRDLVSDMQNITIGRLTLTGKLGFKGRQFSGKTVDQLNNLAHQFGFTWSIQDGVFQAFMDDASTEKTYTFNDNAIEEIRPLKGADGNLNGFYMRAYLDPRVNAGDLIAIDSASKPQYNGVYVANKHTMNGASHSNDWVSLFEMVRN